MLFQRLLRSMIQKGTVRLITAGGRAYTFGDGQPPCATIKLHRRYLEWTLAFYPQLRLGEAYMNGLLTVEEGTLSDFLHVAILNYRRLPYQSLFVRLDRLMRYVKRVLVLHPLKKARRDVSSHYDLPSGLYDLFLDSDRQYSCAYFKEPHVGLERAQLDKKIHIASKLLLRSGLTVLDIGSGWGGLGLYLAREAGCDVTGITLSDAQLALSNKRAADEGLSPRCRFVLQDFRQVEGKFDRLVSVGMFEHVGAKNYDAFFAKARDLLKDDGVFLLHSIGRFDPGTSFNGFIRKYIFPGAELPSLSTVAGAVERAGLLVTDVEILRLHYAETLKLWNKRFQARRGEAVKAYGEWFCRKWEFYLIGCEMSFRFGGLMVFQIQICKKADALPITRDYMRAWEEIATSLPTFTGQEDEQRQRA